MIQLYSSLPFLPAFCLAARKLVQGPLQQTSRSVAALCFCSSPFQYIHAKAQSLSWFAFLKSAFLLYWYPSEGSPTFLGQSPSPMLPSMFVFSTVLHSESLLRVSLSVTCTFPVPATCPQYVPFCPFVPRAASLHCRDLL